MECLKSVLLTVVITLALIEIYVWLRSDDDDS